MFRRFRAVALTLPLVLAACTPSVDLKQAVEVTDISTGWFDGVAARQSGRLNGVTESGQHLGSLAAGCIGKNHTLASALASHRRK